MKYIKLFENFINKQDEQVSYEFVENVAKETIFDGNRERKILYVYETINNILERFKKNNTVNRILKLNNITELDKNNLGKHYTLDTSHEEYFLYDIGILDYEDTLEEAKNICDKLYNITVKINITDISIDETIYHLLKYPTEDEITLKDSAKPEIINIVKYDYVEKDLIGIHKYN